MAANSAYTSVNQVASLFKKVLINKLNFNFLNFDVGGGKYVTTTEFLKPFGITNLVYDPFNRSEEHNEQVINTLMYTDTFTITCANVLNVIQNDDERKELLNDLRMYLYYNNARYIFIQIYSGDKSGVKSTTTAQMNQKLDFYLKEVKEEFNQDEFIITTHKSKYIIIQPKHSLPFVFR